MKQIEQFTLDKNSNQFNNKYYYTIREHNANKEMISSSTNSLPQFFKNAKNKSITVLNFEAFYLDQNNENNILRSDCTELHSNLGMKMNHDNNIICLSGRGFCGYLTYDLINLPLNDLRFEYGNPIFPNLHPIYIVIQLLLEYD
jgi:hypothetical protein